MRYLEPTAMQWAWIDTPVLGCSIPQQQVRCKQLMTTEDSQATGLKQFGDLYQSVATNANCYQPPLARHQQLLVTLIGHLLQRLCAFFMLC
jgi:hypothetical protein